MDWLQTFALSKHNFLVTSFDVNVMKKMLGIKWDALQTVLGYWDFHVEKELKIVVDELSKGNQDIIDLVITSEENIGSKVCIKGHVNKKIRGNRKYCTICKHPFVELNENSDDDDLYEIENEGNANKQIKIDGDQSGQNSVIKYFDMTNKVKEVLYEKVRNIYSEKAPIIKSTWALLVNPNTFSRVKKVLEYILEKAGNSNFYSHSIKLCHDGTASLHQENIGNKRSSIVVTCDGLPHLIAVQVINNCFKCKTLKH